MKKVLTFSLSNRNNHFIKFYILILFFGISSVYAQANFWERTNGPNEGTVNDFYVAANNNIYAGTRGGVFVSSNNGNNWQYIGMGNHIISSVAVAPNGIIFAGTYAFDGSPIAENGLYISTNSGSSWQLSTISSRNIIDIYVSSTGKIFVTSNTPLNSSNYCYYSTNSGVSWSIENILNGFGCSEISQGPGNSIYIAVYGSLVYSTNDGNTWVYNYSNTYGLNSIDASISGNIFGGSSEMLYRTTNNGLHWDSINYSNIYRVTSVEAFQSGNTFAGTVYDGVWKSSDFGNSWQGYWYPDSSKTFVSCIGKKNNDVWCSFFWGSLFKSSNGGINWLENSVGLSANIIYSILKTSNGNILAGTSAGMHISTDNGINWQRVSIDFKEIRAFSEKSLGELFAFGHNVYKSTDHGMSWHINNYLEHTYVFASLCNINGDIYFSNDQGIYKSTNGGLSWPLSFYTSGGAYNLAKNSSGNIFASGYSKVFRTTNNGQNWTQIYFDTNGLGSISVSPSNTIYVSKRSTIMISSDNGNNWIDMNINLDLSFREMIFDASENLIVTTLKDGVYFFNGNSWYPINQGLDIKSIISIAFNAQGQLLAGTYSSGIYRSTGTIGINPISTEIPSQFSLSQNYPNPFNPSTKIKFQIPASGSVAQTFLSVYDVLGREVATLVNQQLQPGTYEVEWDASAYQAVCIFIN